MITLHMGG